MQAHDNEKKERWTVAVAGMIALATAMGIGRFAFTPILPMMLHDGVIDLPTASWLASANYLGYLAGALLCTFQPLIWRRIPALPAMANSALVRVGLAATTLLTLGMALHWPALWPVLRFAAGVASALVFVYGSGWCLTRLARLGVPAMGAFIYTGPGGGIVLSGLMASLMVAWGWTASTGWLVFGVLALVLTAAVWRTFEGGDMVKAAAPASVSMAAGAPQPAGVNGEMALLALAYGLAGFGYIITATFLPVIARMAIPGSAWLDLFWPILGSGVIAGALLATRVPATVDMRQWLAGCYFVQAAGVAASVVSPSATGFALGSLLLGLPFTAITFFAMQEVRRLRPASASVYMGLVTAMYGIGQIVGPPLAAVMLRHAATGAQGFTLSLEIATASLVAGAALYLWMVRAYPMSHAILKGS